MKADDIKLGYLFITMPKPNAYVGAIMVTDAKGLPQEFRYTDPIQPTKIQQTLYGQVLTQYIKLEVIAETLLRNLESNLRFLLVADETLLAYPGKGILFIRMSETKTPPLGAPGKTQVVSTTEIMLQTARDSHPIRLQWNPKQAGDENTSVLDARLTSIYDSLSTAGQLMDVCEPLTRIEKALELVCQDEGILSANKS